MPTPSRPPGVSASNNKYAQYQEHKSATKDREREREMLDTRGWMEIYAEQEKHAEGLEAQLDHTSCLPAEPFSMPGQAKYLEYQKQYSADVFASYEERQAKNKIQQKAYEESEYERQKREWRDMIKRKQNQEQREIEEEHARQVEEWNRAEQEKVERREQRRKERKAMFRGEDDASVPSSPDDQERFREMLDDLPRVPLGPGFKYHPPSGPGEPPRTFTSTPPPLGSQDEEWSSDSEANSPIMEMPDPFDVLVQATNPAILPKNIATLNPVTGMYEFSPPVPLPPGLDNPSPFGFDSVPTQSTNPAASITPNSMGITQLHFEEPMDASPSTWQSRGRGTGRGRGRGRASTAWVTSGGSSSAAIEGVYMTTQQTIEVTEVFQSPPGIVRGNPGARGRGRGRGYL